MGAQISIITVLLHVSHHLLNPEGFREFKDEDISSKKRFERPEARPGCNHILSPTRAHT